MPQRYRPFVLHELLEHGIRPALGTPPARAKELLNDLYCYELRTLRARLLRGEFPKADYAGRVVAIRNRYPLLSVPLDQWTIEAVASPPNPTILGRSGGSTPPGSSTTMSQDRVPAIKLLLLPKDTNALGTIFGGVILSNIDLASAVEARKSGARRFVTKAMREVEFHAPVFLGDIVSFFTETVRVGRSSITVRVSVEAERWGGGRGEQVKVTEAEVVLVAVDDQGRPTAIRPDCPTPPSGGPPDAH